MQIIVKRFIYKITPRKIYPPSPKNILTNLFLVKKLLNNNLSIFVYQNDNNELLKVHSVANLKDKFSFNSKSDGYYKICVEKTNVYWSDRDPLYFKIKIMSDNMDEPNISDAIKNDDVSQIKDKLSKITKRGQKINRHQEIEREKEDQMAQGIMKSIHSFYFMTFIQVIIILVMGFSFY